MPNDGLSAAARDQLQAEGKGYLRSMPSRRQLQGFVMRHRGLRPST